MELEKIKITHHSSISFLFNNHKLSRLSGLDGIGAVQIKTSNLKTMYRV